MQRLQKIITSIPFQRCVNKKALSACFGWLANRRLPHHFLLRLIDAFVHSFSIDLSEFDFKRDSVRTFNEFFTRKLKPGSRACGGEICAPADGFVSSIGAVGQNRLFQVKGKTYHLKDLLNDQPSFQNGSFLSIYLSLADYHRVHLPFDATLLSIRRIPGTLYSLSPKTLEKIDRVYCRNERVVLEGVCAFGRFYLLLVGAIVVGKIEINPDCALNRPLKQGMEVGSFQMGSSVLLVLESEKLSHLADNLEHLKMGDTLC